MVVADQDGPAVEADPVAPRRNGVVALVAGVLILLDQLSKTWATTHLADGHIIGLVGSLQLRLAHNSGAAFSLGSTRNLGPVIAVLAVVVVAVLVVSGSTTRTGFGAVAVGLVAGGAVGNLIDRAFRSGSGFLGGHVVDWIDPQWWPIFNVADSGVCVGAVALMIALWRSDPARATKSS